MVSVIMWLMVDDKGSLLIELFYVLAELMANIPPGVQGKVYLVVLVASIC